MNGGLYMKLLALLAPGVEELELITVIDLLRRADIEIDIVSISNDDVVMGSHMIGIKADKRYNDCDVRSYDGIYLPGGAGVSYIREKKEILDFVNEYSEMGKDIYAICAAPSILGILGILDELEYTCYPGFEKYSNGKKVEKNVVCANTIITGNGIGGAIEFSLEIIKRIKGKELSERIAKAILYKE